MKTQLKLRRIGDSLHMTIPAQFVQSRASKSGDPVFWLSDTNDLVTLKFYRAAELVDLAMHRSVADSTSKSPQTPALGPA
jgi:hypothetical protein